MKNTVHGFMLALANFSSIFFGFVIYYMIKGPNQIIVQVPIAIVLSCIIFSTYLYIYSKTKIGRDVHISVANCYIIYIYSLVWSPIIFIPIHFITQGYLTSFGNISYQWLFQIVTNIIVIFTSRSVVKPLFINKASI